MAMADFHRVENEKNELLAKQRRGEYVDPQHLQNTLNEFYEWLDHFNNMFV